MFAATVYQQRRAELTQAMDGGLVLFLGNRHCPMNCRDNVFPLRQDGSFLYYCGLYQANCALLLDVEQGLEYLVLDEPSMLHVVFCGEGLSTAELAQQAGVERVISWQQATEMLMQAIQQNQEVHYLPPYQAWHQIFLQSLQPGAVGPLSASAQLIHAVSKQRILKTPQEVAEIEQAVALSAHAHRQAMRMTQPGGYEYEIVAALQAYAIEMQSHFAYPIIFSVHGEVLHNNQYANQMQAGQLVLHDSGLVSKNYYASDITRTFPVSGVFTPQQAEIYALVASMQQAVFKILKPGVLNRDCHLAAARCAVQGLQQLGLMQGDVEAGVTSGAYALFFPHGIGHQLGLDVHDMEALGEDAIGYSEQLSRSKQFGLSALRFGRALEAGMVITVEPGIYFIPALIKAWQTEKKHSDFICYSALEPYLDFGGVRIEDNILITDSGYKNLSAMLPSSLQEVEQCC